MHKMVYKDNMYDYASASVAYIHSDDKSRITIFTNCKCIFKSHKKCKNTRVTFSFKKIHRFV